MSFITANLASYNIRHSHEPMSNDQLRKLVPSAFATQAHESRSARYSYIPTAEVIDGLRANGFVPVSAKQGNSRVSGKEDFTKHLIRFRYSGEVAEIRHVGQTFPEIVLLNSHDGTSAYQIMAGLFRLICLNGMVVSDKSFETVKVPHKGDVTGLVIEGSYTVLEESRRALTAAATWGEVTLNRDEQVAMAEAAHVLRFGDAEGETQTPIRPDQLLATRRHEDGGADLWRTFNRIQENAIRGGLTALGRDASGQRRRVTTKEVKGIDQDVRLNRALWLLSERMAALKAA